MYEEEEVEEDSTGHRPKFRYGGRERGKVYKEREDQRV